MVYIKIIPPKTVKLCVSYNDKFQRFFETKRFLNVAKRYLFFFKMAAVRGFSMSRQVKVVTGCD